MPTIPLDPGAGGQCITQAALEPADIIVSTTEAAVSATIRAATVSRVSHSMLYIGGGWVIEAIGSGVQRRSLSAALNHATLAVAYRARGITSSRAAGVVRHAQATFRSGAQYDTLGAAGAGLRYNPVLCYVSGILACGTAHAGLWNDQDKFYCSELVLDSFQRAGMPLTSVSPGVSVPQYLVRAHIRGRLLYVGHLIV